MSARDRGSAGTVNRSSAIRDAVDFPDRGLAVPDHTVEPRSRGPGRRAGCGLGCSQVRIGRF
jgi:hypothetical protein